MKQFISRVKNLSQKAAEIKAAVQQLPPKVAEIRETMVATTGQLQQLKSEIHFTLADLKADSEDRLSQALLEIKSSAQVFAKAGLVLRGIDLEISPVQRLLVHLHRKEDVHASMLRSLVSENQHQRTIHALLSAILQAKQMAETVEVGELQYREIIVGVGPVPSVRLCWSPEESAAVMPPTPPSLPAPAVAATKASPASFFGESSFFAKPTTPATPTGSLPAPAAEPLRATTVEQRPQPAPTPGNVAAAAQENVEEKRDPLARFKRMPDLTKYGR